MLVAGADYPLAVKANQPGLRADELGHIIDGATELEKALGLKS